MTPQEHRPTVFGRLIENGLRSALRGGTAYLALFTVVHTFLAFSVGGRFDITLLTLMLVVGPLALLTTTRSLGTRSTIACSLCLILAAALNAWSLPVSTASPDYRAWAFGAIAFVLLGYTVIDRHLAAWSTMVAVAAVAVVWSVTHGLGPMPGIDLVIRHFATLLVGSLFAVMLARFATRERALIELRRQQIATERSTAARMTARAAAVADVISRAGPALATLARGRALSDADRLELLVIEGDLRDRIRAPLLVTGRLPLRLAAARRRHIDVVLLDDSGDAGPWARRQAAEWLADQIDQVTTGRFVGRCRTSDGELLVSAVTGSGRAAHRIALQPPANTPTAEE